MDFEGLGYFSNGLTLEANLICSELSLRGLRNRALHPVTPKDEQP